MNEEDFQALMRHQALLSRQVVQEAKIDRKLKILSIVSAMLNHKSKIQLAAVLIEVEQYGFSEDEAYLLLDELILDGALHKVGEGYLGRL